MQLIKKVLEWSFSALSVLRKCKSFAHQATERVLEEQEEIVA